MAKKKTTEDLIIAEAVNTIMHTIHVAAIRIADKYERQLITEVVTRIQAKLEASDMARESTGKVINDKLDNLSKD